MTAAQYPKALTFAVYPTSRGFGWAALAGPLAPYDGGLFEATKDKNRVCLRKIVELLERIQPETLALETFERRNSGRADRITRLCRAIVVLANSQGIEFVVYSRLDVERTFAGAGARTRQEIAEAVARHLPALGPRLPPKRKPWKSEDRRMALFNAAALVLTHYRYSAQLFLDGMGRGA